MTTKEEIESGGQLRLKFFDYITWVDANMTIQGQASFLIWMYGSCIEILHSAAGVLPLIQGRPDEKCLIICSSRLVEDCYKTFKNIPNVFPKVIVFCGSESRCIEITTHDHYCGAVENAYCDLSKLVDGITKLEQKLSKDPYLMSQKIQIPEKPPVVKPSPQSQSKDNNLIQQPLQKPAPIYFEAKEQQPPVKNPKSKKQQKPHQQKNRRTGKDWLIIWALNEGVSKQNSPEVQEIKNNYIKKLETQGFPIDKFESTQVLKHVEQQHPTFQLILIAKDDVQLESLQSHLNNLRATIIVATDYRQKNEINGNEHEVVVNSVDEIIKCILYRISSKL